MMRDTLSENGCSSGLDKTPSFFSLKKVCVIWFSPCLRALSRAADLRIEELLMLRASYSFFVDFYWE